MSIVDNYQEKLEAVVDRIIRTHDIELAKFGGAEGIRDYVAIEASVGRVMNAISFREGTDEAMDALDAVAMLTHSILKAHAFIDGNKRAGAANMEGLLDQAGFRLDLTDKQIEDKIVDFASSSGGWEVLSDWIREHAVLRDGYEAADDYKKMPSVAPK